MNAKPSTHWAELLMAKHIAGERLHPIQLELARRALNLPTTDKKESHANQPRN